MSTTSDPASSLKKTPPPLAKVAQFLDDAFKTGKLGSGPTETPLNTSTSHLIKYLIFTIPWTIVIFQLVWSSIVVVIAFFLAERPEGYDTFNNDFWSSKLNVSSSVSYGVGWALFVLLGFFIREASARYREGQVTLLMVGTRLQQLVRLVKQLYPPGTWHPGDVDRIAAHIIAYPIALKMSLRRERDPQQLSYILHPDDVADIIKSDVMHVHCTRVIRAYFSAAEDDARYTFHCAASEKTPCGWGARYFNIDIVDAIDFGANTAVRIAEFRPALSYINHLSIFLYIWLMFLPLAVVGTSGWFTILWCVLISYGVGSLYTIANALNEPFGFDVQDVKLNRLCAKMAHRALMDYTTSQIALSQVIRPNHTTPNWLDAEPPAGAGSTPTTSPHDRSGPVSFHSVVFFSLLAFTLWSAGVVFTSWALTRNDLRPDGVRWWDLYVPFSSATAAYVSLGVFLLLGFWMSDAYGRYRRALQIWQTNLRPILEDVAFRMALVVPRGKWHVRDRERFFSFLAALPYVAKLRLRESRDLSDLTAILDPDDIKAIEQSNDVVNYVFSVLYGYLGSADRGDEHFQDDSTPFGVTVYFEYYQLWAIEGTLEECRALRVFPISPSFTLHLRVLTVFWLMLLPLTLVSSDGFLSFLYLIPIGFSIINLLRIGNELADPFGTDKNDLPLDLLCREIKDSLHIIYRDTSNGVGQYYRKSSYDRESFKPKSMLQVGDGKASKKGGVSGVRQTNFDPHEVTPTPLSSLKRMLAAFPSVNVWAQLAATVWSVVAVVGSWGLSKTWDRGFENNCRPTWCSPVDVNGSVLANVGFALFMILAFRASDAIGRYDEGAEIIFDMEMVLRNSAIETVQLFEDGHFHPCDKERIVAHLVQIPLCFRDLMLGIERGFDEREGLLTDEDRKAFENSSSPIDHLIRTAQTYFYMHDTKVLQHDIENFKATAAVYFVRPMLGLMAIRQTVARALGVKRYPVVTSYTKHQHLFTGLWLALLPLSMTRQSGFLTILWSSLISYGVFGMESIATKLVDPYGHDSIDLPVDDMCTSAANTILEGVHAVGWDCADLTQASTDIPEPVMGTVLQGTNVYAKYSLAHVEKDKPNEETVEDGGVVAFEGPAEPKMETSLYAHLLRSVPWWTLIFVTVWSLVACVLSYIVRNREFSATARWWKSFISIGGNVGTYLSFSTFTLLGFYVSSAFGRYHRSGDVWGDGLRASCHALASMMISMAPRGGIHEGDHERILGHIAAIPLVLKQELRDSRDIREIKGLVSREDIGRIQSADSMVSHCVDVLRSYLMVIFYRQDRVDFGDWPPVKTRSNFVMYEVKALERAIRSTKFTKSFAIAPGFMVLLNALLFLWFLILPFVLAELSGWFTVLWVPLIAYGLMGMYQIAQELQNPYGTDLNDLNLEKIANAIVEDVLHVQKYQKNGLRSLVRPSRTARRWKEISLENAAKVHEGLFQSHDEMTFTEKLKERAWLALKAVPLWVMVGVAAWSGAAIGVAYVVSRYLPQTGGNLPCFPWFCSAIAVDSNVKEYVGFALFLLLGFRLYDSHSRYVSALTLWQDGLIGGVRILVNRLFESFGDNNWHEGDLERICGHISAFAICLMGALRNEDYEDRLLDVLPEEDVRRVLSCEERVDYCLDVVFAYLVDAERMNVETGGEGMAGGNELWSLMYYARRMESAALECNRMVRIPLPFGYVQHLRIFLTIWLLLLPLGLVESTGWLSILWIMFIAYGVVGIEKWAEELSDPFGFDVSDVPLEALTERMISVVEQNLQLFRKGLEPFVRSDREAFPTEESWKMGGSEPTLTEPPSLSTEFKE